MIGRSTALLTACTILIVVGAAACNSGRPPVETGHADAYLASHRAALEKSMQCLLDHDAIPESDLKNPTWLNGKKLVPNLDFTVWYNGHSKIRYRGHTLPEWADQAEAAGEAWKCPL